MVLKIKPATPRSSPSAAGANAPDASLHNPDPDYLRDLIAKAGVTQRGAASRIGVGERAMRYYLTGEQEAPYPVQYCLEQLAANAYAIRDGLDAPPQRPIGERILDDGWYWFEGRTYDVPRTKRKFRAYVLGDETLIDGRRYNVSDWRGHARILGPVPENERDEPGDRNKGWREF